MSEMQVTNLLPSNKALGVAAGQAWLKLNNFIRVLDQRISFIRYESYLLISVRLASEAVIVALVDPTIASNCNGFILDFYFLSRENIK